MIDLVDLLRTTEPFQRFSEETRRRVAGLARHRHIDPGTFVTTQGESWPYLALVEGGRFQAVKESPGGRSLMVHEIKRGDLFWGLTFFDDQVAMPVALVAEEEGMLAVWHKDDLLPILLDNGEALWSLCRLVIRRVLVASAIVEDLAFQPVAGRLAKMLLQIVGDKGSATVTRDLTLDDMAARLGTTREMVCRLLYRFADEQWIRITRTEFSLLDPERLGVLAGGGRPTAD